MKLLKSVFIMGLSLTSFHLHAEGYLNEYMVVFVSEEDPEQSPWKDKLECSPTVSPTREKGVYEVQYLYPNQSPLTSVYFTTEKPKKYECEHLVHFPDHIQGSGVFESYYPNGKQRSRIEYTDGEYDGKLQFWHANGLKEQESIVRNGLSQGDYKIWHRNGQLALAMKYVDGVQTGIRQRWYESGEPWTYARFENDKIVGELKQWFKNGQLERFGEYKNGVRHGIYKTWFDNGKPEAILKYQSGDIIEAQCWNKSGKLISHQECIENFDGEQ